MMDIILCKECEFCHLNIVVARSDNGYESKQNICERNKWFVPEDGHCHRARRKTNIRKE